MLILSRKKNEQTFIGPDIVVTILKVNGNRVKLGIEAPKEVAIDREENTKRKSA